MARNIDGVILRGCEIVQQLDPEYWIGWESEAEAIRKGDIKTIVHKIVSCLHEHGIIVAEIHGIIHDKDEHEYINPSTLLSTLMLLELDDFVRSLFGKQYFPAE